MQSPVSPALLRDAHGRATAADAGEAASVLLLSMREAARQVGYCALYEFEDVVSELMDVELVAPRHLEDLEPAPRLYRLARLLTLSPELAGAIPWPRPQFRPQREYELFFAVFNHPHELFALRTVAG